MNLETLYVEIKAEMSGFNKSLKSVKSQLSTLEKTTSKAVRGINNSVNSMNTGFKKLGSTLKRAISVAALVKLGSAALNAASDLEEAQNVINVVFGQSAAEIDEWASNCITQFGLTEYAAKNAAGNFKAMANGMGIADSAGKEMSLRLTELAADLASFRNTEVDVANTALSGVFTGETEALKKFGVVMTEANLQAFALSQGITKSYNAMTQAEKVALRYKYVMSVTADAQGDFVRSANSWANQVKVLKAQWTSFLSVLGTALKQVLTPLLKGLNSILASLITTAKTIGAMLGIDFSVMSASVSSAAGAAADLESGTSGVSDDLDAANSSAKKLNQTLAGFDQLNILADPSSGSDSGSGGSSGSGGGGGTDSSLKIDEGAVDTKKTEQITKKSLTEMLNDLNGWFQNTLTPWFAEKGSWLAGKFNDLVDNVPWEEIGATVASGLNAIITGLDEFWTKVDGYDFGNGLSTMINRFVEDFDAEKTGHMIGAKIETVLDFTIGFIHNLDTHAIGEALGDLFNNLDVVSIAAKLGQLFSDVVISSLQLLNGFLESADTSQIEKAFRTFFENVNTEGIGVEFETLKKNLDDTINSLDAMKLALNGILGVLVLISALNFLDYVGFLSGFMGELAKGEGIFTAWDGGLASMDTHLKMFRETSSQSKWELYELYRVPNEALQETLQGLPEKLKGIPEQIKGTFSSTGEWLSGIPTKVSDVGSQVVTGVTHPIETLKTGFSALWKVIAANPLAVVILAITALIVAFVSLYKNNEEFREHVDSIIKSIKEALKDLWDNHLKQLWEDIKELLKALKENISEFAEAVKPLITAIVDFLGVAIKTIIKVIGNVVDVLSGVITFLTGVFTGDWKKAWSGVKKIFKGIWDGIKNIVKSVINVIIGLINGMLSGIASAVNLVVGMLNKLNFTVPDWVPGIGGKKFGFNITWRANWGKIPYLADGGVLTGPTVAMLGEYAGARHNPEIAVPQNILKETINASNEGVVETLMNCTYRLIKAIEDNNSTLEVNNEGLFNIVKKQADKYTYVTGKSAFI